MPKLSTHLWYNTEAVEAAEFYASVFKDSKIKRKTQIEDTPSGKVDIVVMDILGHEFQLISAGPLFKFNESVSFIVTCDTQEEIDYYWGKLSAVPESEQCGWLKDKFGLSWQIVPKVLGELMNTDDKEKLSRVTQAFLQMKKFDIAALEAAAK